VSWLFAVLIPGLLMLATFGLERLESGLGLADGGPSEASTPAARAVPASHLADTPQARGVPTRSPRTLGQRGHVVFNSVAGLQGEPGLPTRVRRHEPANPQFQPTPHPNPV
jgi:hypothetical protein